MDLATLGYTKTHPFWQRCESNAMLHPLDAANDSWGPKGRAVSWRTGRKFACHALRKHWPSSVCHEHEGVWQVDAWKQQLFVEFQLFWASNFAMKVLGRTRLFPFSGTRFCLRVVVLGGSPRFWQNVSWGDDGVPRVDDQMSTKLKVRALALFLLWRWLKIFQHFYYLEGFESDFTSCHAWHLFKTQTTDSICELKS